MGISFRATAPLDVEAALPMALLMQHLKDPTDEDLLVAAARSGALGWIEKRVGYSLSKRTWTVTFGGPFQSLHLPMGPVAEVVSFQYVDQFDVPQVWPASSYRLAGDQVVQSSRLSWQTAFGCMPVTIEYLAGFTDLGAEAPALQTAALMLAGHFYRNREENTTVVMASMPFGVSMLIEEGRMPVIA